jgi:hypothetical protein
MHEDPECLANLDELVQRGRSIEQAIDDLGRRAEWEAGAAFRLQGRAIRKHYELALGTWGRLFGELVSDESPHVGLGIEMFGKGLISDQTAEDAGAGTTVEFPTKSLREAWTKLARSGNRDAQRYLESRVFDIDEGLGLEGTRFESSEGLIRFVVRPGDRPGPTPGNMAMWIERESDEAFVVHASGPGPEPHLDEIVFRFVLGNCQALLGIGPDDTNEVARAIHAVEHASRYEHSRWASFEFESSEAAEHVRSRLRPFGSGQNENLNTLSYVCDATVVAEMVRVALHHGGKLAFAPSKSHADPLSIYGKYVPPESREERNEHIERLRERLESLEYEVDLTVSDDGRLLVLMGDFYGTSDAYEPGYASEFEDVQRMHEFELLTRRLLRLLAPASKQ